MKTEHFLKSKKSLDSLLPLSQKLKWLRSILIDHFRMSWISNGRFVELYNEF